MKKVLVCGAGGFIGGHLVERLQKEDCWVRGVDLKQHEYRSKVGDEFVVGDLRDPEVAQSVTESIDEVYQLAADMGGAGYVFTGKNDAHIMHNSVLCNLNVLEACRMRKIKKIFYSSSACMYPKYNQLDPHNPNCSEDSAYPAAPDSEYGWEKLFSERLYLSYYRNYDMKVRIARYHNIFGPQGAWRGGKEKSPAAICRKVAEASPNSSIEIWGDGKQTRSFLYVDECIEATRRLMESDFTGPVNIGSTEMITINELAIRVMDIAQKQLILSHVEGPLGVRGRNSDNTLMREKLRWVPEETLAKGLQRTYQWIKEQVQRVEVTE